jgi:hypothetical protein
MGKKNKQKNQQTNQEEPSRKGWKEDGNPKLEGPNRPST